MRPRRRPRWRRRRWPGTRRIRPMPLRWRSRSQTSSLGAGQRVVRLERAGERPGAAWHARSRMGREVRHDARAEGGRPEVAGGRHDGLARRCSGHDPIPSRRGGRPCTRRRSDCRRRLSKGGPSASSSGVADLGHGRPTHERAPSVDVERGDGSAKLAPAVAQSQASALVERLRADMASFRGCRSAPLKRPGSGNGACRVRRPLVGPAGSQAHAGLAREERHPWPAPRPERTNLPAPLITRMGRTPTAWSTQLGGNHDVHPSGPG